MTIWIPDLSDRAGPLAVALADAIESDIADGKLRPGERLPPQRDLAYRLGVSVGTVTRSYGEARRRGLVAGRVGSGTFVREALSPAAGFGIHDPTGMIDLSVNLLQCEQWPEASRRALAELEKSSGAASLFEYQPAQGCARHRQTAADWIALPGFAPGAERIVICNGAQNALAVVLSALTRPGDVLLTEAATFPPVKVLAEMYGLRLEGVAMDSDGLDPAALDVAARAGPGRVLYTIPSLQNPTGTVMPEARRREIAEIARRHDLLIVEDDVTARLLEPTPTPIAAYAPERCWYVTSVSKSLAPGLRIGYLAAPNDDITPLLARMRALSWMASALSAEIVELWIRDGTAESLVRCNLHENKARTQMALDLLGPLPISDKVCPHVWVPLPDPWRTAELTSRLIAKGVRVAPAEAFVVSRSSAPPAIRISLSAARDRESLRRALTVIAETLAGDPVGESTIL